MDFRNKRVLVVGTGMSGIAAVKLLDQMKADIILYDSNENLSKHEIKMKLPDQIELDIMIGDLTFEQKQSIQLVVLSPGVPTDLPFIQELRERQIPIWGEVELAYVTGMGNIIAITGTNGKTTTTALTGEIMKTYFESVYVVGNIGIPYTNLSLETKEDSVIVAEMSSFQLETIHTFHPNISAILNITPDHLNRHHSMEAYIEAKLNITKNQTDKDICILNYEDAVLREKAKKMKAKVLYFSSKTKLDAGIYLDELHNIIYSISGKETIICNVNELQILGLHNYENVMAATGIAFAMGVPLACIKKALLQFQAVEHRIEFVAEKKGVYYYNDSKGTNPDAAIKAVQAMNRNTVLIAGGYDKDSDYTEWIQSFGDKVTYLILVGQTKEKIAKAAKECGFTNIILADTFEEAVTKSREKANSGEAVLLSPACASWGMFQNYEERGNVFKELVHKMEE